MEYQKAIKQIKDFVEEGMKQRTQTGQRNFLERIMRVAATNNVLPLDAMFGNQFPSVTKSDNGVVKKQEMKAPELRAGEVGPKPLHIENSLNSVVKCSVCGEEQKSIKALNGHMKKHRN